MKKSNKIIPGLLFFIVAFFIFDLSEFEPLNRIISKDIQAFVFSITLIISIFIPKFRTKLFYLSFFILLSMIGSYLINEITLSNALASLGIGILLLTSLSYLPEIIKKGYIEKL